MAEVYSRINPKIKEILKRSGVGVIPTDTLYGVVGSALIPKAVERIYALRKRARSKPMIILVGSLAHLRRFGVNPGKEEKKLMRKMWPGPVSIIFSCPLKKFSYLHRGTKTLALRLPKKRSLRALLRAVGPLVAPSANPQGRRPARTVREAQRYFGDRVDFYVQGGRLTAKPSSVIKMAKNKTIKLR